MYVATVKRPLHSALIASLSEKQQPNVCVCACVPATNLRLSAGPLDAEPITGLYLRNIGTNVGVNTALHRLRQCHREVDLLVVRCVFGFFSVSVSACGCQASS